MQNILRLNDIVLDAVKSDVPENTSPFEQGGQAGVYRLTSFICDYCQKRMALGLLPTDGLSYFVFIPPEFVRDIENLGNGLTSLRKNKSINLTGKLFLCLDSSINKVRVLDFDDLPDGGREELESKLREIEAANQRKFPHAVLDFSVQAISVFDTETGALDEDETELMILMSNHHERFSKSKLNEFSSEFHEDETKLPSCAMRIWKNQSKYILTDATEERIALRFSVKLSSILGKDYVSQETRGARGRADLIIHTEAMIEGQGPCVLEFKVLRNSESSRSEDWLRSGILQVLDYGRDRNAKSHYLMVYDGRKKLGKLDVIDSEARREEITYLHFEMFNTVDGERRRKLGK